MGIGKMSLKDQVAFQKNRVALLQRELEESKDSSAKREDMHRKVSFDNVGLNDEIQEIRRLNEVLVGSLMRILDL